MIRRHTVAAFVLVVVVLVLMVGILLAFPDPTPTQQIYGVTFSPAQATGIGLDWKQTYTALLADLGVKQLRLNAYWDVIEPADDVYDWSTIDYQMDLAEVHGAHVILSIGRKIPRWPECHVPAWAAGLSEEEQQAQVLEMLEQVVVRYREHPALRLWQLENEPLLNFGICPPQDLAFLSAEQALVRSLDDRHAILITDSGELNSWLSAARFGDVLGTTMYRTVFSDRTQKHFFYDYIFPAWGYRLKARYVKLLRGKDVFISELQGEPWGSKPFHEMTDEERLRSISPRRFLELQEFAQRTQLPEAYWWGVEYWYWEKEVNNDPVYWEIARRFFH